MLNAEAISDVYISAMAFLFVGIAIACCVFPGAFFRVSQRVEPGRDGPNGERGKSADPGGVDGGGGTSGLREPPQTTAQILQLKR